MPKKIQSLLIGGLEINPPIIQGGMGVRVSKAGLAVAVANEGCVGVISTVGLGDFEHHLKSEFVRINEEALRQEIRKAKSLTSGVIGVNVLVALSNYENLTRTAAEEGADLIICGAGLPLNLPGLVEGKPVKLIPIISSARALSIIYKKWKRQYNRTPDAVVVEGAKAGGHLGYDPEQVKRGIAPELDEVLVEVIKTANSFEKPVPVIAAGGIFDGKDIARVLKLGASGVQMATRFVCTDECDAHINFKMAYINAKKEDIIIINSPVGMPGRVINNDFVENIKTEKTIPTSCKFKCLNSCTSAKAPYCIARALTNAAEGNLSEGIIFAGSNAYKCNEIVSVKHLLDELVAETEENL